MDAAALTAGHDSDADLAAKVEAADGYAQVFPEHKYRIVWLLQSRGDRHPHRRLRRADDPARLELGRVGHGGFGLLAVAHR
jgi:hypothetical protein